MAGTVATRAGRNGQESSIDVVYEVLMLRWQSNNAILWQLFAFLIAAQAALAVGMAQSTNGFVRFLLGCIGMGGLGIFGPLAIRFIENILLLDRLLLDTYERRLLSDPDLLLHHGLRMRTRLAMLRNQFDSQQVATLERRRMTGLGKFGAVVDLTLDRMGQASLLWTVVVAGTGGLGFTLGLQSWPTTQNAPRALNLGAHIFGWAMLVIIAALSQFGSKARSLERTAEYWSMFGGPPPTGRESDNRAESAGAGILHIEADDGLRPSWWSEEVNHGEPAGSGVTKINELHDGDSETEDPSTPEK